MTAPFSFQVTRTLIPAHGKLAHMWRMDLTTSDGQTARYFAKYALSNAAMLELAINESLIVAPE